MGEGRDLLSGETEVKQDSAVFFSDNVPPGQATQPVDGRTGQGSLASLQHSTAIISGRISHPPKMIP